MSLTIAMLAAVKALAQEEPATDEKQTTEAQDRQDEQGPDNQEEEEPGDATAAPESGDDVTAHLEEAGATEEPPDDEEEAGDREEPRDTTTDRRETVEDEKTEAERESGDNVTGQLEEADVQEPYAGLLEHGPLSDLYGLWKPWRDDLKERTGINVGLAYTTLGQVATRGEGPRDAWSGDFDLFGKWDLLRRDADTGSLGFLVEQRHRYGRITPSQLGTNIGALWGTTKGFNTEDFAIVQLWWEQFLFEDHVKLTAGKLDPANFYNGNRFQSQNTFFLNRAFSENPARAFPDNSLGANLRLIPAADVYVSLGLHDTNGTKTTTGFGGLDIDDLFYAAEIGVMPTIEGLGGGRYRFTYWYTGGGKSTDGDSGGGFALSLEQDIGNGLIPFFRYGYQDRDLRDTKQIVSGGVGVVNPFGRADDVLGIGFAWGQPEDDRLRDQYVAEAFYRLQLTPKIQVTPGYQIIFDPSKNPDQDVVGVFEFRVRVVF